MSHATQPHIGAVVALWRYPVKSMQGEEWQTAQVRGHGLLGDRAYALLDRADGKVATAKNPRKWPNLFAFRSTVIEPSGSGAEVPPVRMTLRDGTVVTSTQRDCHQVLSQALNREVTLAATARGQVAGVPTSGPKSCMATAEEYCPDMEGLDHRDTVTDFALPPGTFFDCATVHLLTPATLNRLGDEVRLSITGPCGRCVMTTIAQAALPQDREILHMAVHHHQGQVGVYAAVVRGGTIRCGDRVQFDN
jgi:uncharacterized protein YcbX